MALNAMLRLAERLTGTRIFPAWKITGRGIDLYEDIAGALPATTIDVVFDVGAHVGESSLRYLREFPAARIYSFEPVAETFRRLRAALPARVECLQVALGPSRTTGRIVHQGHDDMYYLLDSSRDAPRDVLLEEVRVETLDAVCESRNIPRISFLKVDTEGSDLGVLEGAATLLRAQRVDIVQVEAGMNGRNRHHVPFARFVELLEPMGYFLFGIYEQVQEWPTREPHLRRTNPVFVSENVIAGNRA